MIKKVNKSKINMFNQTERMLSNASMLKNSTCQFLCVTNIKYGNTGCGVSKLESFLAKNVVK